jgi:pimeloyl-ACP methyl ester carboxylesterase
MLRASRWLIGLLALLAPALAAPAAAEGPLQPCRLDGVEHPALCGTLQRPLDPAAPGGRSITLHYAVLPALSRHKRPDAVFFFAGGPGQSAIDAGRSGGPLLGRFSNRRDIVLIDQRGTGRSAPLSCDDDAPQRPLRESADPAAVQQALQRCRQALQQLPHGDLRQYTTAIATQDTEAVRQALGLARINLAGASYGTRAALDYLRQFPQPCAAWCSTAWRRPTWRCRDRSRSTARRRWTPCWPGATPTPVAAASTRSCARPGSDCWRRCRAR